MNWKIKPVHEVDWYGRIIYDEGVIEINMDINPLRRTAAAKHEMLHAIYGPVNQSLISHDQIVCLATFLATLPRLLHAVEHKYGYPVKIFEESDGYRVVPGTAYQDRPALAKAMINIFCAYHKIYSIPRDVYRVGMLESIPNNIELGGK